MIDNTPYFLYVALFNNMSNKKQQTSKLSIKSKLLCMNEKHKDEEIKVVCLSANCS